MPRHLSIDTPTRRPVTSLLRAAALLAIAGWVLPASAEFIITDRTVANGNPLAGNYNGQPMLVGVTSFTRTVRVPNLLVDVVDPAQFAYNDQTGGGLEVWSNSVVRVLGGSFGQITANGFGGGLQLYDTSQGSVSGGTLQLLNVNGAAAGAAGARATVSGGLIQNGVAGVAIVQNGVLEVTGGTVRANGGGFQSAIVGNPGSDIAVSGGLVQAVSGPAATIAADSRFSMTGGTLTGGPNGVGLGLRLENPTITAALSGGTVNGGVRGTAGSSTPALQATFSASVAVNGGIFALGNASFQVYGGSFTRYAGADASFFTLGSNSIEFVGSGLMLSSPTAGSVFDPNGYSGNFYTFVSGTFRDGQSAVGLRLFDAVSVFGSTTGYGGGFTLTNMAPVPEPGTAPMMLLALAGLGWAVQRRARV